MAALFRKAILDSTGFDHHKIFSKTSPSDAQAGARGAGLLSNPNEPSSDWLKKHVEVGALERGGA